MAPSPWIVEAAQPPGGRAERRVRPLMTDGEAHDDPGAAPSGPPRSTAPTTSTEDDGPQIAGTLSPAQRAVALRTGSVPIDRAAALRAGSVPVPRRFVFWVVVGFVVLGLGGLAAEKLIGTGGVGALATTPETTLAGTGGPPSLPAPPDAPPVNATPSQIIGLAHLGGRPAPPVALEDQSGAPWSLRAAQGKVVVLTFLNAECNDICPVLSSEIIRADQDLGARRTAVDFVIVNSDPLETSLSPTPPALTQSLLGHLANVTFLNGSLHALAAVWRSYGITVTLDTTNRVITHSDTMDFIDQSRRLELSASPFANEDSLGVYSLQSDIIVGFAQGVADAATSLFRGAP